MLSAREQKKAAQAILDARALYPDSSLADLYDEVLMPVELRRAHQANDRAVMEAYGFWGHCPLRIPVRRPPHGSVPAPHILTSPPTIVH